MQAPGEFEDAFLTIIKRAFEAVVVGQDGMLTANIKTIAVLLPSANVYPLLANRTSPTRAA